MGGGGGTYLGPSSQSLKELVERLEEQKAWQRGIDAQRAEKLYVSEKYKVFFVTKQPRRPLPDIDNRSAYIAVKPFGDFTPDVVQQMKLLAEPWDEKKSQVRISQFDRDLVFVDAFLRTESFISISRLDKDVQEKLAHANNDDGLWKKYTALATARVGTDTPAPPKAAFRKIHR